MRWTVRSALLFLALGAMALGALNLAGRVPVAGPTAPQVMQDRFAAIAGSKAVSLGGSIGTAVDFDAMCLDGAEFYNNGQDPFEIEALVELILARPAQPELFFVVVTPTSLSHDNGLPALAGANRRRTTYRFLHGEGRWDPIAGDWRQAFLSEAMPAIGHDLRDPWHEALLRLWQGRPAPDRAIDADTRTIDPRTAERLVDTQLAQWREDAHKVAYYDPGVPDRASASLLRTVMQVEASGSRAVIVVPPYLDELRREVFSRRWGQTERFDRLLDRLADRGAIIADFWNTEEFAARFEYFRDATHLNAPGAREFSRMLAAEIQRDGRVPLSDCV